jgi:hypothetical protein
MPRGSRKGLTQKVQNPGPNVLGAKLSRWPSEVRHERACLAEIGLVRGLAQTTQRQLLLHSFA